MQTLKRSIIYYRHDTTNNVEVNWVKPGNHNALSGILIVISDSQK